MGCCFSLNEPSIKFFDQTPPGENYSYLRPEGTLTFRLDGKYNVPVFGIQFDGWFENPVCLWPSDTRQIESFLWLERTPLLTPSVSSCSDSGSDTLF